MPSPYVWLIALGPLALAAVGAREAGALRRARFASLFALVVAIAGASTVILAGPRHTPTLGFAGIGLALALDALSATMFLLVAFVGAIVIGYSAHYLDGDPRQGDFVARLSLTLAAAMTLILAGNLFLFAFGWIGASLALHGLLTFRGDRPNAIVAARKKFLASRLGDVCLIGALALVYRLFGGLDLADVARGASALGAGAAHPASLDAAALLLVAAAALKSAQFPTHGWLLEVMETPTPVSALLHAGLINAGGYLILRLAPLVALSAPALHTLAILGGFTALFASFVMLTQTSIKVSLAYSTVAQMGFMLFECGLGMFSAAALHIVAHSLYKAHAFLSSGGVIDIARASWSPSPGGAPHPARLAIAVIAPIVAIAPLGAWFGAEPGVLTLGAIVMMGVGLLIAHAFDERPSAYVIGGAFGLAALVAAAYLLLQAAAERWFATPSAPAAAGPAGLAIDALAVASFAALTAFQLLPARRLATPAWRAIHVHALNGFYVNTIANRWLWRVWPAPRPNPARSFQP